MQEAPAAISAVELSGGLVIHDPGAFVWSDATMPFSAPIAASEQVWRAVIEAAQLAGQSTLARLTAPSRRGAHEDFERILADHVGAARRARSSGFDGIELDASAGSATDRLLHSRKSTAATLAADDVDFFDDLLHALVGACGRDRVGVRFAPFRRGGGLARGPVFDRAIRSAHEQEIAYVHLVEAKPPVRSDAGAVRLSPAADAVRRAYPGAIIASGGASFEHANALVENRWADAYCFQGRRPDQGFAGPDSRRARAGQWRVSSLRSLT